MMSQVCLVNCSDAHNPAVLRLEPWLAAQGHTVTRFDRRHLPLPLHLHLADGGVYLSAIFSWDLPLMVTLARQARQLGKPVYIGGPATEHNAAWVEAQTGTVPWKGQHPSAKMVLERPVMTWTSRGCPNHCPFCIVWRMEGTLQELPDDAWQPAPLVMDNNFLACSDAHQERVVRRLADAGHLVDFNQGLDAQLYTPAFRQLLQRVGLRLRFWRFAYDMPEDWPAVERALLDLRAAGVNWSRIRVYLLYNWHESPTEAQARAERIIGQHDAPLAVPWPMAYRPLDWLHRRDYIAQGWTAQAVRDFRRYYSRPRLWRSVSFKDYDRGYPRGVPAGYTDDWNTVATEVKTAAGWRCEHCGHPHDPEAGYALTVHHLDGDPQNNAPENLVALCQRCHLRWQALWLPGQLMLPTVTPPAWMTERGWA